MNNIALIVLDELRITAETITKGPVPRQAFLGRWHGAPKSKIRRALAELLREGRVLRVRLAPPLDHMRGYELASVLTQMAHAAKGR